jgi:ubiquinone/menaquinone biosynthesis C-methylase UbiE
MSTRDRWAEWLLDRRSGGDPAWHKAQLDMLAPIRDRVLDNAALQPGNTLLDLGSGDGLIPFAALDRVGPNGTVVFSDISSDLLNHSLRLATQIDVIGRCRFLEMPADDLHLVTNQSVDVVTTRSVLIYVDDKQRAFSEIQRVLKPGGRLSIFEPINSYSWPEPPGSFMQMDVTAVQDVAAKARAGYDAAMREAGRTMLDFDERDLVRFAEQAGFTEVHLEFQVDIQSAQNVPWETYLHTAFNPCAPTLAELMADVLTPEEQQRLNDHLRAQFEQPNRRWSGAVAYLWAVK